MSTIKAPFNFVPLSDKVYFPDWADKISHDIPFSDGLSGTIELKITAQTPIFVRNSHTKADADAMNDKYKSFSKIGNQYFIPGTSIKGAIRNVLEIMSFGKMRLDKNAAFAQREWDNTELFPIRDVKSQANMHCGWLRQVGEKYEIVDCGLPMRIAHTRIDEYLRQEIFYNHFSQEKGIDLTKPQKIDGDKQEYDPKCAVYKYKLIGNANLSDLWFSEDDEYAVEYKENRVKVSSRGDLKGTIVLTGQPDKWMYPRPQTLTKGAGKFYEFVFLEPERGTKKYEISEQEFNHYKFIYTDSPDWKYAKDNITKQGIPVFFRIEKDKIKDWGLAFLYKLPYEKSPYDTLSKDHKKEDWDLSDCIFGTISKDASLKGRVMFTSAISENAEPDDEIKLTLGSPKASYYPIYIKQNGLNGRVSKYNTYNDSCISGWKRYVVRANAFIRNSENDNIDTVLQPLRANSTFKTKMCFHNLKHVEFGALLSAITFHNTQGCYHQIGQGKPYGFGKVSITIEKYPDHLPEVEELMAEYEECLYKYFNTSWVDSNPMQNLITLAHNEVTHNDVFDYMVMTTDGPNDFVAAKIAKEYLETYTKLSGQTHKATSLYEKKIQNKFNNLISEAEALRNTEQWEDALAKFTEAKKLMPNCSDYDTEIHIIKRIINVYSLINEAEKLRNDKQWELARVKTAEANLLCENSDDEVFIQLKQKCADIEAEIKKLKDEEKAGAGLSFLLDINLKSELKINTLTNGVGRIEQFLKKNSDYGLSEKDYKQIKEWLGKLSPEKKGDIRELKTFDSKSWQKFKTLISPDLAKQWFDEIVNKQ